MTNEVELEIKLGDMRKIAGLLMNQRLEMVEIYITGLTDLMKALEKAVDMRNFTVGLEDNKEIDELLNVRKDDIQTTLDAGITELIKEMNDGDREYYDLTADLTHATNKEVVVIFAAIAEVEPTLEKVDELLGGPQIL